MLWDTIAANVDQLVLYSMHRRMPASFRESYHDAPRLEEVLAETAVDDRRTPSYSVLAPGARTVWLRSLDEALHCHVRVRLSADPSAPLLIYHHGFSEMPYYNSWRRIFRRPWPYPLSTVCIQAPFHNHWREPFHHAFASFRRVYQTFAGSLRLIELVRDQFAAQGAAFTVLAGVSWGGVTSMLAAGLMGGVRAVAPMLSSPNLAQVIWDGAETFNIPIPISKTELEELLDFTPYYRRYDPARVFPLLGETDRFFRLERHAAIYDRPPTVVGGRAHVLSLYGVKPLRRHLLYVLAWAGNHPLPGEQ